jgi:hypothetical protein
MELSPSQEANNCSKAKKFPEFYGIQNVHYHAYKSPLELDENNGVFLSYFCTKNFFELLFSAIYGTCPAQIILFDLIILIIFG